MMKKIFVCLVCVLLLLPLLAVAEWDSPEPTNLVQSQLSFLQRAKLRLMNPIFKSMAVVNGGQCSVKPDDTGAIKNLINTQYNVFCTNEATGCRLCLYDSFYNPISCTNMGSGQQRYVGTYMTGYWERYNCYARACTELSEFQNGGCGQWTCPTNQMYRYRQDSCGNTDKECIFYQSCRSEDCEYKVGDWGECIAGKQTREIVWAGCKKETDSQACVDGTGGNGGGSTITGDVIIEANNIQVSVTEGNVVTADMDLTNKGTAMSGTYIVEMQVRPKGQLPLSVVSSEPETCDPNHLENVHKQFTLDKGETSHVTLYTLKEMDSGKYDVYLLTRTKCYKDLSEQERGNLGSSWRVTPWPLSVKAGTVCVGTQCSEESASTELWPYAVIAVLIVLLIGVIIWWRR